MVFYSHDMYEYNIILCICKNQWRKQRMQTDCYNKINRKRESIYWYRFFFLYLFSIIIPGLYRLFLCFPSNTRISLANKSWFSWNKLKLKPKKLKTLKSVSMQRKLCFCIHLNLGKLILARLLYKTNLFEVAATELNQHRQQKKLFIFSFNLLFLFELSISWYRRYFFLFSNKYGALFFSFFLLSLLINGLSFCIFPFEDDIMSNNIYITNSWSEQNFFLIWLFWHFAKFRCPHSITL